MTNNVVARFKDGRVLKGSSLDAHSHKPTFHLRPPDGPVQEVERADLKAIFFVRSLDGDAERNDRSELDPEDRRARGMKIVRVTFEDDEEIVGLTSHYPVTRQYFFVLPVDQESNNIRILVNRDAMKDIAPAD